MLSRIGAMQLATYDAQVAKIEEQKRLEKLRPKRDETIYTGPKIKFEDTGFYKAMVKTGSIEEELTKIRNLIRKRTDPGYDPDEDDFTVQPVRAFDKSADYYKLLNIDDFATTKDIKGAYKRMALQYHPDKNRGKTPDELRLMQTEFDKIHEAYEVLSDRATRRQYDRAKFDEARAKNQGMGGVFKTAEGKKEDYWSRWSAKKDISKAMAEGGPKIRRLPKAKDLRVEVKISLNKALRGGLKILDVERDRMQRAYGGEKKTGKTFHIAIAQGQADGSELRMEGEGNYPSHDVTPGDLVFAFKHKPHPYLRQVGTQWEGTLEFGTPLAVRAKATEHVLSAWSPTFKGQMVLVRFLNPLLEFAPSKACSMRFYVKGEGFPIMDEDGERGRLVVNVNVQLEGEGLMASLGDVCCTDVLRKRHMRSFNHQHHLKVILAGPHGTRDSPVRRYTAEVGEEREGRKVAMPVVLIIWESPHGTDPIAFAKAAAALGGQAKRDPGAYVWGYHAPLLHPRLPAPVHVRLEDEEIASDDESSAPKNVRRCRVKKARTDKEHFLLAFGLGPPSGLDDPSSEEEEPGKQLQRDTTTQPALSAYRPAARPTILGAASVRLDMDEQEGEEERELTQLIRTKQDDIEEKKRKWESRKESRQGVRDEDETLLRELLENDKKREYDRIEREMNGLRSTFEVQVSGEEKWRKNFSEKHPWAKEWVCVFKPHMVARKTPKEDAQLARQIAFNDVVKSESDKPSDDYWIKLASDKEAWALIWHPKHGKLLQKWYGGAQQEYLELEAKIDGRRQNRNKTFLEYKRLRKEVSQWAIPPGPSEEEKVEIDDEEGEQLYELLAPILAEIKQFKGRLRDLRKKRLEAAAAKAQREAERVTGRPKIDVSGELPTGFRLEAEAGVGNAENAAVPTDPRGNVSPHVPTPQANAPEEFVAKKQAADKAFGQKDWNTALSLYTQALELGGETIEPQRAATVLSNRALVMQRLDDWEGSLRDATEATMRDAAWAKGWLRKGTAELRLNEPARAMDSLRHGVACAGKSTTQFLPLVTECEAALYSDARDGVQGDAPEEVMSRIEKFRNEGGQAFEKGEFGIAALLYTRAIHHRSMMEPIDLSRTLSNRAAAFLKLELAHEALQDALASHEKWGQWAKPMVRAGQAALLLQDFKAAYRHFAKARKAEDSSTAASEGVNDCLRRIVRWDYPEAAKRWSRFSIDRKRPRDSVRVWALSDVHFDQIGSPEWCKSLSSSFFRDDVLMLAGNVAGSLQKLKFGLTVLKSKFRRVFYVPGNTDLWVRKWTIKDIIKGEKVEDELKIFGDSLSKFLEVLHVCDEIGVETTPAEIAAGLFVVPLMSWYSRDFVPREIQKANAAATDVDTKVTIDQWIRWPFPCDSDDAWKFFMRMNEPALRATLVGKAAYEQFCDQPAVVLTMTHFLTRPELKIDWTVPGIWDYVGCDGLDEQIRTISTDVHVYGRACKGAKVTERDGVSYVHNYIGKTDEHRPDMAAFCIWNRGKLMPKDQPEQQNGVR